MTSSSTDTGTYSLTVTFIPDDHSNVRASATPATSGTAVAGNIEAGDDQDYFSIAASGAGTLTATTNGSTDTVGHLYNNVGTQLATDDNGGAGSNFSISYSITAVGTYYVKVTSSSTDTGTYSLTVTFIPDDHSNVRASATPATSGTAITGNIETGDDQDYFSITASGAGTLTATTTGSTDTVGHLYDNGGTQLATDDNGGTGSNFSISYNITAAGTYYVRVTSKSIGTGTYSLTVTFTLTVAPAEPTYRGSCNARPLLDACADVYGEGGSLTMDECMGATPSTTKCTGPAVGTCSYTDASDNDAEIRVFGSHTFLITTIQETCTAAPGSRDNALGGTWTPAGG